MLTRLRIILVCLLALALPVQGFAAATMLFCVGGSHHRGSALVASAEMGGGQEGGGLHKHPVGTPAHEHAASHDEAGEKASADAATALDSQRASSSTPDLEAKSMAKVEGKCSACSACCASVAIPSTLIAFQPVKADSPLVAIVTSAAVGFLTGGQDRPPRTFLV